jgi:hypothetical protein
MSENAIDSENISKPAPDTTKPKGAPKPVKESQAREEDGPRQEDTRQAEDRPHQQDETRTPGEPDSIVVGNPVSSASATCQALVERHAD